ncbi:MAG: AsmA-like C-terminal region-containing protein, partial [Flavobacteriales bacterium]
ASTPFHAWLPNVPTDVQSVLPVSGTAKARGTAIWDLEQGLLNMFGAVSFSQLAGKLDGQPYLIEAPELRMESASCSGDSIALLWAGNDVELDVRNLSWGSGISGGPWTGDLHVRAQSLHVNPILSWWEHSRQEPAAEARFLPDGSSLRIDVDSKVVEWDALRCTDLSSRTKINHNRWVIQSASIQGLEGRAHVEGSLGPGRAGWLLSLRGTADDVSLPSLFSTYNNFGQDLIRHDHLGGAVSTAGNLGMSWGLEGEWHSEDFTASLQTRIDHGRLTGLEVFEEVADYLEGHRLMAPLVDPNDLRQRLRDISFDPVAQNLDVRGEKVWLPMTVIQSSAMNVAIEGEYRFDSTLDYTLGFALRDLRASAVDSFGEMEDDGLGNQFFLRMSGPVEEPVYAYDRDAAREHRRRAIETEKNRLKDALRNRSDQAPQEAAVPALEVGVQAPVTEPDHAPTAPQPSLMDRVRKPKGKKADDLLNPDDEDYL